MQVLQRISDITLYSQHNDKPIAVDVTYLADESPKPVIVFVHGFKGFKDWGHFPRIAEAAAESGFVFVKFNLSHNGTTPNQPTEFTDLEAFGKNTLSIELDDIGTVIDYLFSPQVRIPATEMDLRHVYLIGHSRGGGLAIVKAAEDMRVKKVVAWAAMHDFASLWRTLNEAEWQTSGVQYVTNSRTQQPLPLNYALLNDYQTNQRRLNICRAAAQLTIPLLLVHGDADETVPVQSVQELQKCQPDAAVLLVKGGQHTFGGAHPFTEADLPEPTRQVMERTFEFLRQKPAVQV